jgi:hypothetical protein
MSSAGFQLPASALALVALEPTCRIFCEPRQFGSKAFRC